MQRSQPQPWAVWAARRNPPKPSPSSLLMMRVSSPAPSCSSTAGPPRSDSLVWIRGRRADGMLVLMPVADPQAEVVNGRCLLSHQQRVALREHQDSGSQPNALSPPGEIAQNGERLEQIPEWFRQSGREQDVVAGPQRRIAQFLRVPGDRDHGIAVPEAAVVRQVQAE